VFDSWYEFSKVGVDKTHNKKYLKEVITYSFKSDRNYYLVEVEAYTNHIYIVKFYLKKDKQNPLKYHLLTNENKGSRIISNLYQDHVSHLSKKSIGKFWVYRR
jgi:hypothetical protein